MALEKFIFEYLQLRKLNKLEPFKKNLIFYSKLKNNGIFMKK